MYTRSYFTDDKKVEIPENYDGNAFTENGVEDHTPDNIEEPAHFFMSDENEAESEATETVSRGVFSSFLEKLHLKDIFKSFPFGLYESCSDSEKRLSFGTEELLICVVALYMFFSKDGDKECAIMLAFLLFIK